MKSVHIEKNLKEKRQNTDIEDTLKGKRTLYKLAKASRDLISINISPFCKENKTLMRPVLYCEEKRRMVLPCNNENLKELF